MLVNGLAVAYGFITFAWGLETDLVGYIGVACAMLFITTVCCGIHLNMHHAVANPVVRFTFGCIGCYAALFVLGMIAFTLSPSPNSSGMSSDNAAWASMGVILVVMVALPTGMSLVAPLVGLTWLSAMLIYPNQSREN